MKNNPSQSMLCFKKTGDSPATCDIFCKVIDNYGDIGVSWRLARQLANEFGIAVRLWVDDLASFARLCPEADAALDMQHCRRVEVRLWTADAFAPLPQPLSRQRERVAERPREGVIPADLVIEAFACTLPESYVAAMLPETVWINLEYLSAEDWVEGCHKLPSPHPRLPLTKYFFFPGFTKKTGGLILERDFLVRRDVFLKDSVLQSAFWHSVGMDAPSAGTLKISLFSYENAALEELFDVWSKSDQPVLCLVPQGRILPQVVQYFERSDEHYVRGNLQVRVLPFVEQEKYDELLWACDVNFVRGEDSCVRAQWAGKPFVWQIYPQHDEVHWKKLQAFLDLYSKPLSAQAAQAMQHLWETWNGGVSSVADAWDEFAAARAELDAYGKTWARELSENNLALNLLDFFQEIGTMPAFKADEQST